LGWVLAAALIGAAGNELVARYRIRAGRRIGSAALIAEGQHARTDAMTSLAVVVGVIGAWAGLPWIDPLIGLLIAAMVVLVLISSIRTVVRRLMDGVEPETVQLLRTAAEGPGVLGVHEVRARWIGHRLDAELTIDVDPGLTVEEAEPLTAAVRGRLHEAVPHLERALVQLEPAAPR
ncbi:MAG: cation diffusion facilitator family transporter, partial [Brachybacterium sp.]|uniref:cation diffusion facilitator family transporter n=1 Tax=Brachybacterium sp. TaxID=1891286 RepID=UPI00324298B5